MESNWANASRLREEAEVKFEAKINAAWLDTYKTIAEAEAVIQRALAKAVGEMLEREMAEFEHRLIHGTGVGTPKGITSL